MRRELSSKIGICHSGDLAGLAAAARLAQSQPTHGFIAVPDRAPVNLAASADRADRLRKDPPDDMTVPQLTLRFALHHPAVSTVVAGMRRIPHMQASIDVGDGVPPSPQLLATMRRHRWNREPIWWPQ